MEGGCRTCIRTRMPDARHRRQIIDQAVVTGESLIYQPLKAVIAELIVIPGQIVPAHLVYHNSHNEFRTLVKLSLCLCTYRAAEQHQKYPFSHNSLQRYDFLSPLYDFKTHPAVVVRTFPEASLVVCSIQRTIRMPAPMPLTVLPIDKLCLDIFPTTGRTF